MSAPMNSGRSGSGLTVQETDETAVKSTVITRLRAKQSQPGRAVLRRQARTARKGRVQ